MLSDTTGGPALLYGISYSNAVCTTRTSSSSAALYYTILYYTILYYTIRYDTILCRTTLYYTIQADLLELVGGTFTPERVQSGVLY